MADLVHFFKNLLLQTHQSECYLIWVTTLGQGRDVELLKSCRSHDQKCVKMANLVNFGENRINSFNNLLFQTHQSECYQMWVTTLGQDRDVKLRRPCRSRDRKCVKMTAFVNFWEKNRRNSFPPSKSSIFSSPVNPPQAHLHQIPCFPS